MHCSCFVIIFVVFGLVADRAFLFLVRGILLFDLNLYLTTFDLLFTTTGAWLLYCLMNERKSVLNFGF